MTKAHEILTAAAETNKQRDALYGGNYLRVGAVLHAMFPGGVRLKSAEDFNRFRLLLMCVDKLCRYAGRWPDGHEDSLLDLSVYAAMLSATDKLYED